MVSLLVVVVLVALLFDYINGFHDAANAISTVVSTGVLSIRTAVLLAGLLNFVGAVTGTAVAKTIATELTQPELVTEVVVLSALLGASTWSLITWWYGLPSSSSHALIGGLGGAVVAHAGVREVKWKALQDKVLIPLVASPTLGFLSAFLLMISLIWLLRNKRPHWIHTTSRRMQLASACAIAFSHGSNDAQKSMGIIALTLSAFAAQHDVDWPTWLLPHHPGHIPTWVVTGCAIAIALGTMAGGERIIRTMGSKIIRITPLQGFAAETAGALTILTATRFGVPVSTTHCINACIMGVGASKRLSAVRWGIAGNIFIAWVLTLPLSGLLAYLFTSVLKTIF